MSVAKPRRYVVDEGMGAEGRGHGIAVTTLSSALLTSLGLTSTVGDYAGPC